MWITKSGGRRGEARIAAGGGEGRRVVVLFVFYAILAQQQQTQPNPYHKIVLRTALRIPKLRQERVTHPYEKKKHFVPIKYKAFFHTFYWEEIAIMRAVFV